jgi:predicted CXXCH cytochrome family protein
LALRSVENDVEWREQAAVRDLRVCGDCHGSHAMNPNVPDLTLSRFPIAALPRSKCFERSLGKLLCTDCHDPHSNAEHADMKSYDRVCLRCHGDSARRASDAGRADSRRQPRPPPNLIVCSVNPNDGCTGCHMPKRQPVYRGTFTHHRIAIHSETGAANSSSEP